MIQFVQQLQASEKRSQLTSTTLTFEWNLEALLLQVEQLGNKDKNIEESVAPRIGSKEIIQEKIGTQLFSSKLTLTLAKLMHITSRVYDHIKKYLETGSLMALRVTNLHKDPLMTKVAIDRHMPIISTKNPSR